jgi:hypothetical protein
MCMLTLTHTHTYIHILTLTHTFTLTFTHTQVLGEYYARDNRNVFKAMWQDYKTCCLVRPDKEGETVYWYTGI